MGQKEVQEDETKLQEKQEFSEAAAQTAAATLCSLALFKLLNNGSPVNREVHAGI
jgi:hypothetical protein